MLETTPKRQAPRKERGKYFLGDRISDEAVSSVTGDEPTPMTLAEVDDSGDGQYSDKEICNNLDDSSIRVSQQI